MQSFDDMMRRGGSIALAEAQRFFMREDRVHETLRSITNKLGDLGIDYAVVGGMALVAHGYERTTVDVDILIDEASLRRLHEELEGRGYVAPFEGSRNLRDAATGVRIEFIVTGQYPGDGKPKPVVFPPPADVAVDIDGIRYVNLPKLVELKLASGMTNPGRLRDLADVQELIRTLALPGEFARQLDASVRDQFMQLRAGVESDMTDQ